MPVVQSSTLINSISGIGTYNTVGQCVFSIGPNYVFVSLGSDQLTGALIACNPTTGAFTSILNASGKAITSGLPYTNSWNAGNCICVTTIDNVTYMFYRQASTAIVYRGTWNDTNKNFSGFSAFATFSSASSGANYNSMARISNTTIRLITQGCYIADFDCRTGAIVKQPTSVGGTWSPSSYPFSNTFATTDGYICGASGDGANFYVQKGTGAPYSETPSDTLGVIRGFQNIGNAYNIHPSNYFNISYYVPNTGTVYAYANDGVLVSGSPYPTAVFDVTSIGQNGTLQSWTVPTTGLYKIDIRGAQGGTPTSYTTNVGGNGARMVGDFNLVAGDVLKILVGQQGPVGTNDGGGGGGTFVVKVDANSAYTYTPLSLKVTPLIVAGGGGGGSYTSSVGQPASSSTSGTLGTTSGTGAVAGTNGNGATASSNGYAGAGAGFLTSGNGTTVSTQLHGVSFLLGGAGGPTSSSCTGGYGGGGGTHGGGWGGGGGGGWSGGSTSSSSQYGGGGGGSYNAGTLQSNTSGYQVGSGYVIISLEPCSTVTNAASNTRLFSTTLGGTITNAVSGNKYIEYGTTTSYGTQIDCGANISGTYTVDIPGLIPNTLYHFRSYVYDGSKYAYGNDATFTTKTGAVTLTTQTVSNITTTTATGNATITGFDE